MAAIPNAGPTARPARTAGQPTDLARTGTICTVAGDNTVWPQPWSNEATSRPPRRALEVVRESGESHDPREAM
jgi:hypothetical protein